MSPTPQNSSDRAKKYAVQYTYDLGVHTGGISFSNIKIAEDTKPISYEEAISLFKKHLDDFRTRLKNDERPNLVIWDDVGDGEYPNYGDSLVDLNWTDDLKVKGDRFYKTVEIEIKLPE